MTGGAGFKGLQHYMMLNVEGGEYLHIVSLFITHHKRAFKDHPVSYKDE